MIKKITTNISRIINENVWLAVAIVIIFIAVGVHGWKWSLHAAGMNRTDDSINALLKADFQNADVISADILVDTADWYKKLFIEIYHDQTYVFDAEGESVFGSGQYIYDDLGCFNYSKVFRYANGKGFIGYGKVGDNGITILYPDVFTQPSKMLDGSSFIYSVLRLD